MKLLKMFSGNAEERDLVVTPPKNHTSIAPKQYLPRLRHPRSSCSARLMLFLDKELIKNGFIKLWVNCNEG